MAGIDTALAKAIRRAARRIKAEARARPQQGKLETYESIVTSLEVLADEIQYNGEPPPRKKPRGWVNKDVSTRGSN